MTKNETQNQKVVQEKVTYLSQRTGKTEAEIRSLMDVEKSKRALLSEYGCLLAVAKNVTVDLSESDPIPTLDKIANVTEKNSINLVGRIKNIYPMKTGIGKKNGKRWKLRAGVIGDETNEIPFLVTDGPTTDAFIANAKHNDIVVFINAFGAVNERTIEGQETKTLELRVNRNSSVKINPEGYGGDIPLFEEYHKEIPNATAQDLNDIAELEVNPISVNIQAMITMTPAKGEGQKADGSPWVKLGFTIGEDCGADDNTFIKVSVWDEKIIPDLGKGDIIKIENGYVKFQNGRPQINVGKYATLTLVKKK